MKPIKDKEAKENLKIFWSVETMKTIVESFTYENIEQRTLSIIKKELLPDEKEIEF
jgi:hypothetical protein